MDPLSAIGLLSGLAGIASAGACLSKSLYDVASNIRGAPKEMEAVAQGIADLSVVLDQLRRVLKEGKRMHRRRLRKGIHGVLCRIEDIHFEIRDMLSIESRLGRLKWVFRKSRIVYLMTRIESHKNTVSLMMQTMLIAIEQRRQDRRHGDTEDSGDEKRRYRRQAENTVKTTLSSLRRLGQSHLPEESRDDVQASISDLPNEAPPAYPRLISPSESKVDVGASISSNSAGEPGAGEHANIPFETQSNQIQKWNGMPDDTATWLYHLIFSDRDIFPQKISQVVGKQELGENRELIRTESPDVFTGPDRERPDQEGSWHDFISAASGIVDSLLFEWTELTEEEIEETREIAEEDFAHDWQLDLQDAVESLRVNQMNEPSQDGGSVPEEDGEPESVHVHSHSIQEDLGDVDVCPTCRRGMPKAFRNTPVLDGAKEGPPTSTRSRSAGTSRPNAEAARKPLLGSSERLIDPDDVPRTGSVAASPKGDEHQASNSDSFTTKANTSIFGVASAAAATAKNNTQASQQTQDSDPMDSLPEHYSDSFFDQRKSTPYAVNVGEKTRLHDGANLIRARSVRDPFRNLHQKRAGEPVPMSTRKAPNVTSSQHLATDEANKEMPKTASPRRKPNQAYIESDPESDSTSDEFPKVKTPKKQITNDYIEYCAQYIERSKGEVRQAEARQAKARQSSYLPPNQAYIESDPESDSASDEFPKVKTPKKQITNEYIEYCAQYIERSKGKGSQSSYPPPIPSPLPSPPPVEVSDFDETVLRSARRQASRSMPNDTPKKEKSSHRQRSKDNFNTVKPPIPPSMLPKSHTIPSRSNAKPNSRATPRPPAFTRSHTGAADRDNRTSRNAYSTPTPVYYESEEEEPPRRSHRSRRSPYTARFKVGDDGRTYMVDPAANREVPYKVKTGPSYGVDDIKYAKDVEHGASGGDLSAY